MKRMRLKYIKLVLVKDTCPLAQFSNITNFSTSSNNKFTLSKFAFR